MSISRAKKMACGNRVLSATSNLLNDPKLEEYRAAGLINEIQLRNLYIRSEYQELKQRLSDYDAVAELAKKYLLSEDSIKSILFRKRKIKSVYRPA